MENNKLVPIYEPTLMQLIATRLQMKYDPSVLRHIHRNTLGFDTMVMYRYASAFKQEGRARRISYNGTIIYTAGRAS